MENSQQTDKQNMQQTDQQSDKQNVQQNDKQNDKQTTQQTTQQTSQQTVQQTTQQTVQQTPQQNTKLPVQRKQSSSLLMWEINKQLNNLPSNTKLNKKEEISSENVKNMYLYAEPVSNSVANQISNNSGKKTLQINKLTNSANQVNQPNMGNISKDPRGIGIASGSAPVSKYASNSPYAKLMLKLGIKD